MNPTARSRAGSGTTARGERRLIARLAELQLNPAADAHKEAPYV
jgi:hypothetical protein